MSAAADPREQVVQLIGEARPDIYVKGKEYEGRLPEYGYIEALGARVVFTDTIVFSSTQLLGWL